MASQVMFLETYIESTNTLPTELQRILNNIRALDEKCQSLAMDLQTNVSALLSMTPAWMQQASSQEYVELSNRVAQDQKMLLQFGDEKTQLAQQALDLLEVHALELERVMDDLDKELKKTNPDAQLDWEVAAAAEFGLETQRGKTPKPADEWASVLATEVPAPTPSALPPVPSQKRSMVAAGPSMTKASKRPRDDAEGGAGAQGGSAPMSKKRNSSVMAQALSSQPSYEDLPGMEGYGGEEVADLHVPFMKPPPVGYKSSATRPQAPGGRYLVASDISPALVGRHAELFWPDDNLWYLIEIQQVFLDKQEARVLYSTGDYETLSLEEAARDMHMMLIDEES